jgi:hypothetical protein
MAVKFRNKSGFSPSDYELQYQLLLEGRLKTFAIERSVIANNHY